MKGRCKVYVDGGITQGTDVLKALALGADMVFIGRPILWGLAHSGESGVRNVIQLLKKEFDLAMALSGITLKEQNGIYCFEKLNILKSRLLECPRH